MPTRQPSSDSDRRGGHGPAVLLSIAVAWTVLAIGGVYAWGYVPAGIALLVTAVWQVWNRVRPGRAVLASLPLVACVLVQLVPLPRPLFEHLSPMLPSVLAQHELGYAAALAQTGASIGAAHPLSLEPAATWRGLLFLVAFLLAVFSARAAFSRGGLPLFLAGLAGLALSVAVIGIVQNATFSGRIYGLWQPLGIGVPFGPFVNHNHFAAWMVMAVSLLVGRFFSRIESAMRGVRPELRDRLLWFASARGSRLLLLGFVILIGILSLILSHSRSGALSLGVVLLVFGAALRSRRTSQGRRLVSATSLILLAVVAIGWAGLDPLARRFAAAPDDLPFRVGIWRDATEIVKDFPLAGTGFNTFGAATLHYHAHSDPQYHFVEAHNDYLQLLAEGGVLLFVPFIVLIVAFARDVRSRFLSDAGHGTAWWIRIGGIAAFAAIAVQSVVEFSLQIPANALLFGCAAGAALHEAETRSPGGLA